MEEPPLVTSNSEAAALAAAIASSLTVSRDPSDTHGFPEPEPAPLYTPGTDDLVQLFAPSLLGWLSTSGANRPDVPFAELLPHELERKEWDDLVWDTIGANLREKDADNLLRTARGLRHAAGVAARAARHAAPPGGPAAFQPPINYPININTATHYELMSLPRIGPVRSDRIIQGRPYANLNDLLRAGAGISNSVLHIIRDMCEV